jgi:hypothetical protein
MHPAGSRKNGGAVAIEEAFQATLAPKRQRWPSCGGVLTAERTRSVGPQRDVVTLPGSGVR